MLSAMLYMLRMPRPEGRWSFLAAYLKVQQSLRQPSNMCKVAFRLFSFLFVMCCLPAILLSKII